MSELEPAYYIYIVNSLKPVVDRACFLLDANDVKKVECVKREIVLFVWAKLHNAFADYFKKHSIPYRLESSSYEKMLKKFEKLNAYYIYGKPFIVYHTPNKMYPLGYFKVIDIKKR